MQLNLKEELAAKSLATEVVLMALMREKRGDTAFWNSLDKLMQVILTLDDIQASPHPTIHAQAERAQWHLDSWRSIAGDDPNSPAPPGSGPFDPTQAG